MTEHSRPNQAKKILAYMRQHGSITQREAVEHFNCYRLSARIFELKEQGHSITTEIVPFKGADGERSNYAKYTLVEVTDPCP